MPDTAPYKGKKNGKNLYISKCISVVKKENPSISQEAAIGKCEGMWKNSWNEKKKSHASLTEDEYWANFDWETCGSCLELEKSVNKKLGIFELDIPNQMFASEKTVNLKKIEPAAVQAMKSFFEGNKTKYAHEKQESGLDPIKNPLGYFKIELREPEHKDILNKVNKDGILTLALYKSWQKECEEEKD